MVRHNHHVRVCARDQLDSELRIVHYLRLLYDVHDKLHFFVVLVFGSHLAAKSEHLIFVKVNVLYDIYCSYDLNPVQQLLLALDTEVNFREHFCVVDSLVEVPTELLSEYLQRVVKKDLQGIVVLVVHLLLQLTVINGAGIYNILRLWANILTAPVFYNLLVCCVLVVVALALITICLKLVSRKQAANCV